MFNFKTLIAASVFALAGTTANAVTVGGIDFDDNAFADSLVSSTGTFSLNGSAPDLETAVTGSDTSSFAFSFDAGSNLVLGFDDNMIQNGAGADLAIFELGVPETLDLSLSVGGVLMNFAFADTGFSSAGFDLNVALIDLSDFGVAALDTIDLIQVFGNNIGTTPSFAAFGAINSVGNDVPTVPLPAGMFLMVTALGGFGISRRFKSKIA